MEQNSRFRKSFMSTIKKSIKTSLDSLSTYTYIQSYTFMYVCCTLHNLFT